MRTLVLLLALVAAATGFGTPSMAMQMTAMGYRANEGGGGAIDVAWTTGNMGNAWAEGEWMAYQLIFEEVSPGLGELDSIVVSFDFTSSGKRFVDLVRGLQVGTWELNNYEGWVAPGGVPFPVTSRAEMEVAQNHASEELWTGFAYLNLPNNQVNRTLSGMLDVPDGEERHIFKIYRLDLLAAGIDFNASTVVVYFQLHESRTLIWNNQLQADYASYPTADWGGYVYGTGGWPAAGPVAGSGYVPGSSGHIRIEYPSGGPEIPIAIPETAGGTISGSNWRDENADGVRDPGELILSGWQTFLAATVDGIDITIGAHTDGNGAYSFSNLGFANPWIVYQSADRDIPPENGYLQTFPTVGFFRGQGTGIALGSPPAGASAWGWSVVLTDEYSFQNDMDFGNLCSPSRRESATWGKIKAEFGK